MLSAFWTFLSLPIEIRSLIYKQLPAAKSVHVEAHTDNSGHRKVSPAEAVGIDGTHQDLWNTCKQVRAELRMLQDIDTDELIVFTKGMANLHDIAHQWPTSLRMSRVSRIYLNFRTGSDIEWFATHGFGVRQEDLLGGMPRLKLLEIQLICKRGDGRAETYKAMLLFALPIMRRREGSRLSGIDGEDAELVRLRITSKEQPGSTVALTTANGAWEGALRSRI